MFFDDNDLLTLFNVRDDKPYTKINDNGLFKGTIFNDEYVPYKNYVPVKLQAKNSKEELMLKIYELAFQINEYVLYLDIYRDEMILNKYKEATNKYNALVKDYEYMYGPLCTESAQYKTYKWSESPWPWEGDNSKYV